LYPNSFCSTKVTYDIRLTGSFHTMTTHGRSSWTSSPISGSRTSVGAVVIASTAQRLRRLDLGEGRAGNGRDRRRDLRGEPEQDVEGGGPHRRRTGDVDADEEYRDTQEILRIAHTRLGHADGHQHLTGPEQGRRGPGSPQPPQG